MTGDLLLIFFLWYGLTRFVLEFLRHDNWTFFGVPTAQIVTLGFILVGLLGLLYRHGPGRPAQTAADFLPARAAAPTADEEEEAFWDDESDADGDGDEVDDVDEGLDHVPPGDGAEDVAPDTTDPGAAEPDATEPEPPPALGPATGPSTV